MYACEKDPMHLSLHLQLLKIVRWSVSGVWFTVPNYCMGIAHAILLLLVKPHRHQQHVCPKMLPLQYCKAVKAHVPMHADLSEHWQQTVALIMTIEQFNLQPRLRQTSAKIKRSFQ